MAICGQWFEKQLWTHVLVIAQMSQCAQSFQTHQWLLILVFHCELMCPCASFWPMVWYIPINSETGCSLWAHYVFNAIHYYNLWDKYSLWSYMSLCSNNLQYFSNILYSVAVNTSHLAVVSGSIRANLYTTQHGNLPNFFHATLPFFWICGNCTSNTLFNKILKRP